MIKRTIDGKFHIDEEGRIVKTSNGDVVPEDEPLFLLRARDTLAVGLLLRYYQLAVNDGCLDYHLQGITEVTERFTQFRNQHRERMKQPGITRGL